MKKTQARLVGLIQADLDAGKKVKWLDVDNNDRASLIQEILHHKGPLAKAIKQNGIDVALPNLKGVPLRWQAATTQTRVT